MRDAIAATFRRRETVIPASTPIALTKAFATDDAKQKQWKAFIRRSGLEQGVGELSEVVRELEGFVLPPFDAARGTKTFDAVGAPGRGWS